MFHLSGFKFKENLGSFCLSSLNSQSIENQMQQKFAPVKKQIQQSTHQSDKIQLKRYNKKTNREKVVSQNAHQIQYIKKSDVAYIAATQDPVWPDENELGQPSELNQYELITPKYLPTNLDQRMIVVNCGNHPFNGIGKILTLFRDPVTKQPMLYQEGTAFLISYKHIMTAAHTLYRSVDEKEPTKGLVRAEDFEFFLGPLFLKLPSIEEGQIQHEEEILANGIKAHVLFMNHKFQESDCQEREQYDWAILELELEEQDIRTKQNEKPLKCNFDFDLAKRKDILLKMPGYPRRDMEFETDEKKSKTKKSTKIIRSKEDTSALYFQEMQRIDLSQCKRFLHYEHSVSPSNSGAPLLVLNPQTQKYEMIGVHIGQNKNCGLGLLLSTLGFKSQIESLISNNKHSPIDLEGQQPTLFDYVEEIQNMAVRQEKCLHYKIKLTSERDGKNLLKAVTENAIFFSYLHQITVNETNEQQFISFVRATHHFPHLQKIEITWSDLSDHALFELIQKSSKLTNLKSINFHDNRITDEGLKILLENGHNLACLQTIHLWQNQITGEALKALYQNGHKLSCLRIIDLSCNQITDEGLRELLQNGYKFPCLQSINLRNNQITEEGFKTLVENGHRLPYLQIIDLSCNQITDEGLKVLLENGNKLPCLQFINFSDNQITGERLQKLLENGHKLPCLQTINLPYNQITGEGLKALLENGHKFPYLQTINLRENKIKDKGLKALSENGHKLPSLKAINLPYNKITDEGFKALLENGHKLPCLQTINLRDNQITDEGLRALLENDHKFPCLQIMNLSRNQITDEGLDQFQGKQQFVANLQFVVLRQN